MPPSLFSHVGLPKLTQSVSYICPTTRRERIAALLGEPLLRYWWLPNEEGLTPILKTIRAFTAERDSIRLNEDQELVREVRHLFGKVG